MYFFSTCKLLIYVTHILFLIYTKKDYIFAPVLVASQLQPNFWCVHQQAHLHFAEYGYFSLFVRHFLLYTYWMSTL